MVSGLSSTTDIAAAAAITRRAMRAQATPVLPGIQAKNDLHDFVTLLPIYGQYKKNLEISLSFLQISISLRPDRATYIFKLFIVSDQSRAIYLAQSEALRVLKHNNI